MPDSSPARRGLGRRAAGLPVFVSLSGAAVARSCAAADDAHELLLLRPLPSGQLLLHLNLSMRAPCDPASV